MRVEALEHQRVHDLAWTTKQAFMSPALLVLIAYHFGKLRENDDSPFDGWIRAVGLTLPEFTAHRLKQTLRQEDAKRFDQLCYQLWLKGRRSKESYSLEAMEEAIERLAKKLPQKWQKLIDKSVDEQLESEARFFEIEKTLLERFGVHF